MLFFMIAGAAVLEVHRLVSRKIHVVGDEELHQMKLRERSLKQALQASEKELKIEKEQRVKDVAKLAADKSSAEQRAESLMAENTVLQDRSQALLARFEDLENMAAGLKDDKSDLASQVVQLQLDTEAQNAATLSEIEKLKADVAEALDKFAGGDMTAEELLAAMTAMGVELRAGTEALPALAAALEPTVDAAACAEFATETDANVAKSVENMEAGSGMHLAMGESWTSRMQLVTDSRERMSRLLSAANMREGLNLGSGSGAQPLLYGYPSAKTPPKTNGSTTAGSQRLFDVASIGMQSFTPRSFKENQGMLGITAAAASMSQDAPASQKAPLQPSQGSSTNSNTVSSPNSILFRPGGKRQSKKVPQQMTKMQGKIEDKGLIPAKFSDDDSFVNSSRQLMTF